MKYILYVTTENGEGYVTKVGEYDDVDEIEIRVNTFAPNVVFHIEKDYDDENNQNKN